MLWDLIRTASLTEAVPMRSVAQYYCIFFKNKEMLNITKIWLVLDSDMYIT